MKCIECGGKMKSERGNYLYKESGLDNITLANVEIRSCPVCGESGPVIPAIEGLHRAIAHFLAHRKARLLPAELRFLRQYLGLSRKDYAEQVGISPETVSRYESGAQKPSGAIERLLRARALLSGPKSSAYPPDIVFSEFSHLEDWPEKKVGAVLSPGAKGGWDAKEKKAA